MTDVVLEKQASSERRPERLKQEAPSFKWNGTRTAEGRQRIAMGQLMQVFYAKANSKSENF